MTMFLYIITTRYFFILNMFKDYDKMIKEIEQNISIEDVITDPNY